MNGSVPQKKNLQIYILFDFVTNLRNLVEDGSTSYIKKMVWVEELFTIGPFGNNISALSGGNFGDNKIAYYDTMPDDFENWTIAFFWRSASTHFPLVKLFLTNGNVLNFEFLTVYALGRDIEIATDGNSTDRTRLSNYLVDEDFKFIAIQYSVGKDLLNLFDENGNKIHSDELKTSKFGHFNVKPRILRTKVHVGYQKSSAIACLSVHDSILTKEEIKQMTCSCKYKGGDDFPRIEASSHKIGANLELIVIATVLIFISISI